MILNDCTFIDAKGIKYIEEKYNAKYVFESCLKNKNGDWANFPAAIFYTEEAHPEGSNYFGVYLKYDYDGTKIPMIANGIAATQVVIKGIKADNGDIVYSRYRHDYRNSPDGSVFIDGGRDYIRTNNISNLVELKVVKDKLEQINIDLT